MPGAEHFIFKKETVWGTFVVPDTAIPVTSVGINSTQPNMVNDDTGGGKGRRPGVRGEVAVAGPLVSNLYAGNGLPQLLASMYGTKSKTGTGPFVCKFLPQDDTAFASFSMQKRYSSTLSESFKGCRLNGYKITAAAKAIAKVETTWACKDSASDSGVWADNTAGPTPVATPSYPANIGDPLVFWQGSIKLGGTVALTAGEIVVTAGVATLGLDNITIEVQNGLIVDDYHVATDARTINSLDSGKRIVTVGFEPNLGTHEATFYDLWKAGADAVFEAIFTGTAGSAGYVLKWTAPLVRYSAAPNPELNNAYTLKRIPVVGDAYTHPTVAVDHGLVITSAVDLTL